MNRATGLIYGVVSYAIFFATFLYATGFVGNIFVPKGIDSVPNVPMTQALLINLGLLGIFAIQHSFKLPYLYRVVRHPMYVGWFFAFWCTPTMTIAHLAFAIATSACILIAIQLEERDLIKAHPEYREYRKRVPVIVPFTRKRLRESAFLEAAASAA